MQRYVLHSHKLYSIKIIHNFYQNLSWVPCCIYFLGVNSGISRSRQHALNGRLCSLYWVTTLAIIATCILRHHGNIITAMFYSRHFRKKYHNAAFVCLCVSNFNVCFDMIKQFKYNISGVSKILVPLDHTFFLRRINFNFTSGNRSGLVKPESC